MVGFEAWGTDPSATTRSVLSSHEGLDVCAGLLPLIVGCAVRVYACVFKTSQARPVHKLEVGRGYVFRDVGCNVYPGLWNLLLQKRRRRSAGCSLQLAACMQRTTAAQSSAGMDCALLCCAVLVVDAIQQESGMYLMEKEG